MDKWDDTDQRSLLVTGQTLPLTEMQLYILAKWLFLIHFSHKTPAYPMESYRDK